MDVMILTGAGQIGMAITRRMGYGMKIVIGDKSKANADAIAKTMNEAGFDAIAVEMDLSSRASILGLIAEAQKYGEISMLVNAAGVSPSQASIKTILKVDLYGTAVLLEESVWQTILRCARPTPKAQPNSVWRPRWAPA